MSLIREKLPPSETVRVSIVDNPFVIHGRFWGKCREEAGWMSNFREHKMRKGGW